MKRCWFTNTISSDEPKHLSWSWCRKPMKLELVISISVSCLFLHVLGKVDDSNSLEGASFDADTTAYAEHFGYIYELRIGCHLNTEFVSFVDRTSFFAFLFATFRFTFLLIDNGNSQLTLLHNSSWKLYSVIFNNYTNLKWWSLLLIKLILIGWLDYQILIIIIIIHSS